MRGVVVPYDRTAAERRVTRADNLADVIHPVGEAAPVVAEDAKRAAAEPRSLAKQIMAQNGGKMPEGLTAEEVLERYGIDVHAHRAKLLELQASLGK